jgi:hypothetical protein
VLYTSGMVCRELAALRAEARELNTKLVQQKAMARSTAHLTRGTHPPGKSDYEPLIRRKLERLAAAIQRHKEEHGCED